MNPELADTFIHALILAYIIVGAIFMSGLKPGDSPEAPGNSAVICVSGWAVAGYCAGTTAFVVQA